MPGLIKDGGGALVTSGDNTSPSLYESDAAALAGKTFPANYFYNFSISNVSSSGVNGLYTNTGTISGFSPSSSISGTVQVVDGVTGKILIGTNPFTIMGSTADGQYLVLGKEVQTSIGGVSFTQLQATAVLANNGELPQGTLSFATSNNYSPPNPVCFVRGTLIKTADGYKPIESLHVGESLVTATGDFAVAKWVGRRVVSCKAKGFSEGHRPVRIRAGALGHGRPFKDLLVSPGHRIHFAFIDDIFVPANALINGSTIVFETVDEVEYWHIECEQHTAVLANGVSAETYIDVGNRSFFADHDVTELFGDLSEEINGRECFPVIANGPVLDSIRQLINARAVSLGWSVGYMDADVYLDDGEQKRRPYFKNDDLMVFRFSMPAGDVHLRSNIDIPAYVDQLSGDSRELGIMIQGGAVIGNCGTVRSFDMSVIDWEGLHGSEQNEDGPFQWSDGMVVLPAEFFAGLVEPITMRIDSPAKARRYWHLSSSQFEMAS